MSIDCAFFGFLAADAEQRTSQAGKAWARLRVYGAARLGRVGEMKCHQRRRPLNDPLRR